MSSFEVKCVRVHVKPHPNADNLDLALVEGTDYVSVIGKGTLHDLDKAFYIPEQALVPEDIIEEMGLTGKLAGPESNRVKAIKLRGVLSQGLLYAPDWVNSWEVGADATEALAIRKWKQPIPTQMSGEVEFVEHLITYTDIESLQKHPHMISEHTIVRITEKLHGSCLIVGWIDGQKVVSSKGIAGKHLAYKESDNVYWRAARQFGLHEKVSASVDILIFGELLGVQDLKYGLENGELSYRAFDVWSCTTEYLDVSFFDAFCHINHIPQVPLLYQGEYDINMVKHLASGPSLIDVAGHMREGVVVRPMREMKDRGNKRIIGKYVSPEYLTRKGDTTEYE